MEAYEKAAEANIRGGGTSWHAAKHLEAAAKICVELRRFDRAFELLKGSASHYVDCGKLASAGECLGRGARWLEEVKLEISCQLYLHALDMYKKSEMGSMAHDVVQRGVGAMIRHSAYDEAVLLLLKWATISHNQGAPALTNRAYLGGQSCRPFARSTIQHRPCLEVCMALYIIKYAVPPDDVHIHITLTRLHSQSMTYSCLWHTRMHVTLD